ncbi:hypothetical protein GCM10028825_30530 [Spirosoma agri]
MVVVGLAYYKPLSELYSFWDSGFARPFTVIESDYSACCVISPEGHMPIGRGSLKTDWGSLLLSMFYLYVVYGIKTA